MASRSEDDDALMTSGTHFIRAMILVVCLVAMLVAGFCVYYGIIRQPFRMVADRGNMTILRSSTERDQFFFGTRGGTLGVVNAATHLELVRSNQGDGAIIDIVEMEKSKTALYLQWMNGNYSYRIGKWRYGEEQASGDPTISANANSAMERPDQIGTFSINDAIFAIAPSPSGEISIFNISNGNNVFRGKYKNKIFAFIYKNGVYLKMIDKRIEFIPINGQTFGYDDISQHSDDAAKSEEETKGISWNIFGNSSYDSGNGRYKLSPVGDGPGLTNVVSLLDGKALATLYDPYSGGIPCDGLLLEDDSVAIAYGNGDILIWGTRHWRNMRAVSSGWR